MIYSFSSLHTYENNCPHKMYRQSIKKDVKYVQNEAGKYGDKVHEAFRKRLTSKIPLPPDFAQWEPFATPFDNKKPKCELQLGMTVDGRSCDYWDPIVWLRGRADVVVLNDWSAFINDWKTGNSNYEDRFELDVCALLLHANYPKLTTIKGTYTWLKDNRIGIVYDLSDTRKVWTKVAAIARRIEQDRTWEKRQGPLCGWCDVRDCEHNRKRA